MEPFYSTTAGRILRVSHPQLAMNTLHSRDLTDDERLAEIGEILAVGLIRLLGRKSSQIACDCRESLVDCSPHQSSHVAPTTARKA